jgi:hypothetical protein
MDFYCKTLICVGFTAFIGFFIAAGWILIRRMHRDFK